MRLATHQPYFFPYVGHFSVIASVDRFVFFDTLQFAKEAWMNRNRVLGDTEGWKWIVVPVGKGGPLGTKIRDVLITKRIAWKERVLAQLEFYKKSAPFYGETMDFLRDTLAFESDHLSEVNIHCTQRVCQYLGIGTDLTTFSAMGVTLPPVGAPDEWGLNLALATGAGAFYNAPGGQAFYSREKYKQAGVELVFVSPRLREYDQRRPGFVRALSIIDVLMFNDLAAARQMVYDVDYIR